MSVPLKYAQEVELQALKPRRAISSSHLRAAGPVARDLQGLLSGTTLKRCLCRNSVALKH